MTIQKAKEQVLKIAKRCYDEKLMAGTSGNLSVLADGGFIVITPGSVDYSSMEVDDLVVLELSGKVIDGPCNPSSEWRMHAEIYKALSHIKAVVHTHSPYATSFAVLGKAVPVILNEMIPFIGGDLPVSKFACPGAAGVGINAVESLKDRYACLMQNHGVLGVGKDLHQAYINATYAEDAAKIYHMAKSVGEPVILTGEQQAEIRAIIENEG